MKAFLLYTDRDFDLQQKLPANGQALIQDLELDTLFGAMALGDKFLYEVAKKAVIFSINDLDTIGYRQDILKDCLKNSSIVRDIYNVAMESIDGEKKHYFGYLSKHPEWTLHRSIDVMQLFVGTLKKLRNIADKHAEQFQSEGFRTFFAMIHKELGDEYFSRVRDHLRELEISGGSFDQR